MRLVIFDPPGAGKGTQAHLLVRRRGLHHISTGNILRAAIKNKTPVGRKAKSYVTAGRLVPDAIVRELAEEALAEQDYDDFVLDGYPRTVQQAEWLTTLLEQHGAPLQVVISVVIPDEVIVNRLSKRRLHKVTGENYHLDHNPPPEDVDPSLIIQRKDDRPEAIRRRLRVYKEQTQPVETYFRERQLLVEVDGMGDIETVHARIVEVLERVEPVEKTA